MVKPYVARICIYGVLVKAHENIKKRIQPMERAVASLPTVHPLDSSNKYDRKGKTKKWYKIRRYFYLKKLKLLNKNCKPECRTSQIKTK